MSSVVRVGRKPLVCRELFTVIRGSVSPKACRALYSLPLGQCVYGLALQRAARCLGDSRLVGIEIEDARPDQFILTQPQATQRLPPREGNHPLPIRREQYNGRGIK